jgi:hypothetical protein
MIAGAISSDAWISVAKLVGAAAIGLLVTTVQRVAGAERSRQMEQAQILLCVAGALVVMLIGDSMARALGIMGGAAIVRFRTPVDDPRDATLLFLLLGFGMATGLGFYTIAGLGCLFLCAMLLCFSGAREQKLRSLCLQVVCTGPKLPIAVVESVLSRYAASYEQREVSRGERTVIRYQVNVDPSVTLAAVGQELLEIPEAAVQSLSWELLRKNGTSHELAYFAPGCSRRRRAPHSFAGSCRL